MTAGAGGGRHPRLQTMTIPIAEGVHIPFSGIAPEVAVGTEIEIDMTETASGFIASCRFSMEPGVIPLMVRRSYRAAIGMADLARHGRTAGLHMAGVADRLQGLVADHLDGFKLFQIGDLSTREGVTGHTAVSAE